MEKDRIFIIGPSGSGKSFLAEKISKKLGISHFDLDDIYWIKKPIKRRAKALWKPRLKKIIAKKKWIIEGAFSSWVGDAIKKAELVVWLDISYKVMSFRLLTRYLKRKLAGKEGPFSGTWYLITYAKKYSKRKAKQYKKHKKLMKKYRKKFVLIQNKKQLKQFLGDLKR